MTVTELAGLRESGLRLRHSVVDLYELDEDELALLLQAGRTADLLDELTEALERDGAIHETPQGARAHPAAVERRQQAINLARLVAALRLPAGADGDHQGARSPTTSARRTRRAEVRHRVVRPRRALAADADAMILPRALTVRATSREHGLQIIRAKRAWYLAHGIDPADFQATSDVWQRTGRAYGEPLSSLDRAWSRSVGLEAWRAAVARTGC